MRRWTASEARTGPARSRWHVAVRAAMESGQHLLVQAGTGTGKSLAYLVPALLHEDRVVVATATLALQHQLVERDIPALLAAAAEVLGAEPSYAVLKGRSNYACLHRMRDGVPDDQGTLVDLPSGSVGAEVLRIRTWAEKESKSGGTGDRDSAPAHTDRVWRQVSVNHRECLGAAKCPYGVECFAERARERAMRSSLGRHQPLVARHRRDCRCSDDPGLRHCRDRRGARAGRPGDPGGDRRAVAPVRRASRPPSAELRRRRCARRPQRRRRRAAGGTRRRGASAFRGAAGGGRRRTGDGAGLRADHDERVPPRSRLRRG